jgi:hypothetical protein
MDGIRMIHPASLLVPGKLRGCTGQGTYSYIIGFRYARSVVTGLHNVVLYDMVVRIY